MHKPASRPDADKAAVRKSKLGVILFIAYTLVYGGFVVLELVNPELMDSHILGKQNLSIVYGFGLIVLAMVMGFIYNALCSGMEDKMNGK